MKRLVSAFLLLAVSSPAFAADPPTVIMPSPVIGAVEQYLAQRPYADVAQILGAIQGCLSVQVPNDKGITVSHGECPAVTAALDAQTKQVADLTRERDALKAAQNPASQPQRHDP